MNLNTILRRLDAITRSSLRDLAKLSEVDDDAIELAEALEVIRHLSEKRTALPPCKVRSFVNAVLSNEEVKPPRRERVRLQPKDFSKSKRVKPEQVPFGEYGRWDYPNKDWDSVPTSADIPEVMRQKLMRYPGNELFSSELRTVEWFQSKGWM
jgi:hypothetical protein